MQEASQEEVLGQETGCVGSKRRLLERSLNTSDEKSRARASGV